MTGGLASPPDSRVNSPMVVIGAASAPYLGSIPPPKFVKPIYGSKDHGQLGGVESGLIPSENDEEDNTDGFVKESLAKSLSKGREGNPREDGESSDESDDHQPLSEAEDEGHKTTLDSRDFSETAVVDQVMNANESNMEDVVMKVLGGENGDASPSPTLVDMEDVLMKEVESNMPEDSREEDGRMKAKDSREEGGENGNARSSPTLVVVKDVSMDIVESNAPGVSIDDKGGEDREVVEEQPAAIPTSFEPRRSSRNASPKGMSSPNVGEEGGSSEDIEVPPVKEVDFSEQLAAQIGISLEPRGILRNPNSEKRSTPNGGGDDEVIEATDVVPNPDLSDATLAAQLAASLEPRRSSRSTASKTAPTPMLVTAQKTFNAKRKPVLKKTAIALQVISSNNLKL